MDERFGHGASVGDWLEANGFSLREHVVDEWTGRVGRAVHTGDGAQLSPVLLKPAQLVDWIESNRDALAAAAVRGVSPASAPLTERARSALRARIGRIDAAERRIDDSITTFRRIAAKDEPDDAAYARERVAQEEERKVPFVAHRARIDRLLALLDSDPSSLFLPVGARVRLVRDLSAPAWALEGSFWGPFPAAGTEAVVLGPAVDLNPEFPVRVAFFDGFMDASDGESWPPRRSDPLSMAVSAEDLEVVQLGTYLDGTPCRSLDFVKTHFHGTDRPDYGDMAVVSAGIPVRIMGFDLGKETHWISGQGFDSVDDLDFLTPVDAACEPAAPTP